MTTEFRFLVAIGLIVAVIWVTNLIWPPIPPPSLAADSTATATQPSNGGTTTPTPTVAAPGTAPAVPVVAGAPAPAAGDSVVAAPLPAAAPERRVVVQSPLYRHEFSTYGARLVDVQMERFVQLQKGAEDRPVELVREGTSLMSSRVVVGRDTIDLSGAPFDVSPAEGLTLVEGGQPQTITFSYADAAGGPFTFAIDYTYHPDSYVVDAVGRVSGLERPLLFTDMGPGLAYNEVDSTGEARVMAYVGNHVVDGITSYPLVKDAPSGLTEGPFHWAAYRSKFFVLALMSAAPERSEYFGGMQVVADPGGVVEALRVAQPVNPEGTFGYKMYFGPQDYGTLMALGSDLKEVNPYGWSFMRPVVRPFVAIITNILSFMHNTLNWGYGWVLVLFGVLMRIVLWPFNQKAMKAQMRNMAVQPMVKEIQTKYKDNPQKMNEEMVRLYKEYGFNPMAGCLPMLIPWPVLIALFFVFQNTIEFRGVSFLWLPDLSAPDPIYILPVLLAVSMWAMQYISYKSMGQENQQMKMMMYIFPLVFGFMFMKFAAGLNLYYTVQNIATLPQQYWVGEERKKAQAAGPVKLTKK